MGFAGVLIRTSTERPEVLDKGTIIIGGITGPDIEQAIDLARAMQGNREYTGFPPDYIDACVSVKVVKIIQSYTKIINDVIWRKQ